MVELDPDEDCLTYVAIDDLGIVEDDVWEEDDIDEAREEDEEE